MNYVTSSYHRKNRDLNGNSAFCKIDDIFKTEVKQPNNTWLLLVHEGASSRKGVSAPSGQALLDGFLYLKENFSGGQASIFISPQIRKSPISKFLRCASPQIANPHMCKD
jgi:hypothetical protein